MKPFFSYYGGKWRIAKRYPQPKHDTIVEPFAGSAGYSTRNYTKSVVLIEKDKTVACVWSWLISAKPEDVMSLPIDIPEDGVRGLNLDPGAEGLIGFWLNKGSVSPAKRPSAWMRAGNHNSSFWGKEIRQRIAEQVPYIKHWTIINDDYSVVSDMKNCTWFIDPPYQNAGVYYKQNKIDYEALGKWCLSLNGQVIVCEAMGASWLPFTPFVAAKANESKYGGKVSYECIYTNEPN